ncbi:hypothetical protein V1502_18785 [Bacillus sp. SCS-153A]|uniref:hypothetical protein n=1 Tax=Rossellomorea sedimentorum TaxID=3115294 RepID=UPI0039058724
MKKRYKYFFIMVILITLWIFGFMGYKISQIETIKDIADLTTAVLGLVVALWAFVISMMTYSSIDSVNVITKMEGNVLENENYVTSFTSLLREYNKKNSIEASAAIFNNLEKTFTKESKTAVEFANNLQYFIDVIVFFPYLFHSDKDSNIEKMNKLMNIIEKKKEGFLSISGGNLTLIDETVKLIKSIINYQKLTHTPEKLVTSTLLDVRGTMLKNSVTQTVYYNYLGLFYNKKANLILRKKYGLMDVDFFSLTGLLEVKEKIKLLTDEERELFTLYLQEAKKSFKKAADNGNKDVMWEGFIKFNDARSTYFLQQVLKNYEGPDWKVIMDEALIARNRLNILIKDILENQEDGYLQEKFNFEYYLASLVKLNILIAEKQDITDSFNRPKYYANNNYAGIKEDLLIKEVYNGDDPKVKDYQVAIVQYVEQNTKA